MYTVGDMFAGVGGITLGFKKAGFTPTWANEYDKDACTTYRKNFNHTVVEEDVSLINPKDLDGVDIITSGAPCQSFSLAGNRKGFNDPRGNLFFETARFIDALKPKAYFIENVKNLLHHDKGKTISIIKDTLVKDLNYSFIYFVLSAYEHGNVPQSRERIYIVGFRGEGELNSSKLPLFSSSSYTSEFNIPCKIELNKTVNDIILKEKQDGKYYFKKDHKYIPKLKEAMKSRSTLYQWRRVYVRENKNNLCPTLTANMGTGGHNVPLLVDDYGYRKLTPRECFRFQGFPDSFKLPKELADSKLYKQAGNSVTVPVVRRIAKEIKRVLDLG